MWTNSHLLPTTACVTGPLEGSQATLCSPELLHCGSQEIQERHQHQNQHLQKAFDYKCHNTFGLRSQMAAGHCFSEKERGKTLDQPSWLQTFRNNSGVSGSRRPKCLLFFFPLEVLWSLISDLTESKMMNYLETSNFILVWKRRRWGVIST